MLLDRLPGSFAVLGNHDFASSRDPFSKPSAVTELGSTTAPGRRGADGGAPRPSRADRRRRSALVPAGEARPERLADPDADLRILLCHFPNVIDKMPAGVFDLVLAGHLHGGPDLHPVRTRQAQARATPRTYTEGALPSPGWRSARLARPRHDLRPVPVLRPAGGDGARPTIPGVSTRVAGLTGVTLEEAPSVCHGCVWWQSKNGRGVDKRRWIEKAEDDWGAWGAVYRDDDGSVIGSMQYGPAELFPRAWELPAGPPSEDAVLVTCAYLVERASPWILQSLFLAAIGDARDKRAKALETFAYRYPEGESAYERFLVHRTVFPRDFLSDFGFQTVRTQGRVELARLDLGGLQPVAEGSREKVMKVVKEDVPP